LVGSARCQAAADTKKKKILEERGEDGTLGVSTEGELGRGEELRLTRVEASSSQPKR